MRDQVETTIQAIRPAIQADNGDIFLRDVDEETGKYRRFFDIDDLGGDEWLEPVLVDSRPLHLTGRPGRWNATSAASKAASSAPLWP